MTRDPALVTARVTAYTRVLFGGVVALLVVRLVGHLTTAGGARLAAAVLITGYLGWLVAELRVTFSKPAEPVSEVRTILAYATARALVIISAVLPDVGWTAFSAWQLLPAALFAGGIALRVIAIRHLAAQYTHHVVKREHHVVVTNGPYRFLRHPAYAGMLLANLGFVGFFLNPASVLAYLALAGVLVWRIRTEEKALWSVPGYPAFAAGRARLVAGVW
ncbi:methyltransferase family protein [Actinophytocola sediminis]